MDHIYDKNGIPILVGDTLKVFHYVGARRKKHYIYKHVIGVKGVRLKLSHLSTNIDEYYTLKIDNKILDDYEIVQGFGDEGPDFTKRKRKTAS